MMSPMERVVQQQSTHHRMGAQIPRPVLDVERAESVISVLQRAPVEGKSCVADRPAFQADT